MNVPLRIIQGPQVTPKEGSNTINTLTTPIQERLEALKKEIEATQDAERKKELLRQVARLERFDAVQSGSAINDEKIRSEVAEILKEKNTDTYLASDLLSLRKRGIDIAALTLVDKNTGFSIDAAGLTLDRVLTVNFGANPHLARRTGAGDILPPTIRKVEINGVEAVRGNHPRPGYYDSNGKYQPIYDGYTIKILEIGNALPEDETAMEAQWRSVREDDTENNQGNALSSLQEDTEMAGTLAQSPSRAPKGAWEKIWNDPTFKSKMTAMCDRLGINPEHLKVVMIKESGINPQARNKQTWATGLIQFMPKTAKWLGTSVDALGKMSATDQLKYVEKYYEPYAGKLNSVADLYLATFYPAAIGKPDNFIIGSEKSKSHAQLVAKQNPAIAKYSRHGYITKASFEAYVNA